MTSKEKETFRLIAIIEVVVLALLLLGQMLVRIDVLEKRASKAESEIRIIKTDIDILNNGFEGTDAAETKR